MLDRKKTLNYVGISSEMRDRLLPFECSVRRQTRSLSRRVAGAHGLRVDILFIAREDARGENA